MGRLLLIAGLLLAGCSCDEEQELRVEGDTPYTRCLARPAPDEGFERAGVRMEVEGRTLRVHGLPDPVRLVVMAGSGSDAYPVDAIEALDPSLVVVLGDLGGAEGAVATLDVAVPVLILPGGTDSVEAVTALAGSGEGPIDASVFRRIVLGPSELVPLAGAPNGTYGAGQGSCGFGENDLDGFGLDPPSEGVSRILLSWAGPERAPASAGILGVEAGDPLVSRFAEASRATGAIFAWPRENALRAVDDGSVTFAMAVPPGAGAWVERADGQRIPSGPTLILLGSEGGLHSP